MSRSILAGALAAFAGTALAQASAPVDVRAVMQDPSQGGFSASRGGGFPVEIVVRGKDWESLAILEALNQQDSP